MENKLNITFKELRKHAKLTAEETAKMLGVTKDSYRKYECSGRVPSARVLITMPTVFKCEREEVMLALEHHIYTNETKPKQNDVRRVKHGQTINC